MAKQSTWMPDGDKCQRETQRRWGRESALGVPIVAQQIKNPNSIHQDAGLAPGLAQWVKGSSIAASCSVGCGCSLDPELLCLWYWLASSDLTPSLGTSICRGAALKKHQKKNGALEVRTILSRETLGLGFCLFVFYIIVDLQMLCYFLLYSKVTQSYIYIYIYIYSLSYITFHHVLFQETRYSSLCYIE